MQRLTRIRRLRDEALESIAVCKEAMSRCEAELNKPPFTCDTVLTRLLETYREGVSDAEEALALWSELLAAEEKSQSNG